MIWMIGLVLHMIVIGQVAIYFKLVLYLLVCVAEIYSLKYMTPNRIVVKNLMATQSNPILKQFLPTQETFNDVMHIWKDPIDMDNKANKITYQKARIIVIFAFVVIY